MGCMREFDSDSSICPHCGYDQNSTATHSNHLKPGTMVAGRYLIGRALGSGGFGITYIAWDSLIGKAVAVKEYLPGVFAYRVPGQNNVASYNKDSEEKFRAGLTKTIAESNTLARFNSVDGVVDVYNCVEANGTVYIVMEYLEGKTLKQELKTHGNYTFEAALDIMAPILNALYQIHESGIIHRDISPDNIFLCDDGTVRLIDFGAARMALNDDRKSLSVILKRGYAPKEQYYTNAKQGPWTDVYATAATFYRMLTGIVPQESLERESQDALIPPSELGVELPDYAEHAILRALKVDSSKRTKNTDDFYRQLTDPDYDFTVDSPPTYSDFKPVQIQEKEPDEPVRKKRSKKPLIATLIIAALLVLGIAAVVTYIFRDSKVLDNGYCGENLTWELNAGGTLKVDGRGIMDDYGNYSDTPWFADRDKIKIVEIGENVNSIGSRAFYGCKSLAKIEFGPAVKSIGSYAFYGCSTLENSILPESVTSLGSYSFAHCNALEYLHVPSSVTHFGVSVVDSAKAYICSESKKCDAAAYAENAAILFRECGSSHEGGEDVTVTVSNTFNFDDESTTFSGDSIASGFCSANATWIITENNELIISGKGRMDGWLLDEKTGTWTPGNMPEWAPYASEIKMITIEDGIVDIGNSAFAGFTSLETITMPESVNAIGSNAFIGCTLLKSIHIPEKVKIIGDGAFKDCTELRNANLTCSVTEIGQYTFKGCSVLNIVTLPAQLTSIGDYAFADCPLLTQIDLPAGVSSLGEYTFMNCANIKSLTLSYGISSIPKGAFAGCGFTAFDIPSSVTAIGEYAFSGCKALQSINIPNSVTVIGQGAFGGCSALTGVILPSSVVSIGSYAFSGCSSLQYVHIPSSVSTIGSNIIENTPARICSDSLLSTASSYAARNGYTFKRCANQH